MGYLILRHRRHEGAHIEGKGQIIDIIVRKLYPHKAVLEVRGIPEIQRVHLSLRQPEYELLPELRIKLNEIVERNCVEIAYFADLQYGVARKDYYDQIAHLVLDFPLDTGARIKGDGYTLDVVVREISGPLSHRQGRIEVRDESGSHDLTLVSGEELQPIREGIGICLSDHQKSGGSLRIVYHLQRRYDLQRKGYAPNPENPS